MARYRKVEVQMWSDGDVMSMSGPAPNGQSLWLYLLTGPRTLPIPGVIVGREVVLADDLRWPLEGFREAFREASSKGLARADWEVGLVVLPKALLDSAGEPRESNRPESPNVLKSWAKHWNEIPDCPLKDKLLRSLETFAEALGEAFLKAFREGFAKALSKASRHPSPNQEQEQEQEKKIAPAEPAPGLFGPETKPEPKPAQPAKRQPTGDHAEVVACFTDAFMAKTGVKPTWGDKQGALVKRLIAAHGAPEVKRRIEIMFTSPPPFPPPPHDLATLSQHFDKFARPWSPPAAVAAPERRSKALT